MVGAVAGSALGVAGSIFGGLSASKAMKRVRAGLEKQRQENLNWYNRNYNADGTQRADAQRALTQLGEGIRDRNRQAAATAAVTGATDESVKAAQAANSAQAADAAAQIAVQADRRKDAIEQQYMQTNRGIEGQLMSLDQQKAQNVAQAVGGVASAAGGLMSKF